MAHRELKRKVTGQGQNVVSLTFILDRGRFSSYWYTEAWRNFTSEDYKFDNLTCKM